MAILEDFRLESGSRLIPFQATIELTYRCNERCGHCYLATYDDAADGRPPLEAAEWIRIFDQLARAGTLVLVLIGGEAMMHPRFWELAEAAAARGFALSLVTNGLLIDDAAAERMKRLGFYQVSVSLYSHDPAIHDRMTRRKGSHHRTQLAVERLSRLGVEVVVNCLLTSLNIDTCLELESWAEPLGVRVQFDPLVTAKSDGSLDSTATRASPEQLLRFYRARKARGITPAPQAPDSLEDPVCNQGRGKCAINAYGDLLTCLEVRDPIGNLRERSFEDLWRSDKADQLRNYKNSDLRFDPTCGDGAYCDHCPGMAIAETGDAMAPVPFLMELARIKRQVHLE